MRRPKLDSRARDARPPGPVYRDVAPNREVVTLYGDDGKPSMTFDLDCRLVAAVRRLAKREKTTPHTLLIRILQDAADRHERGF